MNDKEDTGSDRRWTERKLDLTAEHEYLSSEREYLSRQLDAVTELLKLVDKQQTHQDKPDNGK